jgi:hypothetical protein
MSVISTMTSELGDRLFGVRRLRDQDHVRLRADHRR